MLSTNPARFYEVEPRTRSVRKAEHRTVSRRLPCFNSTRMKFHALKSQIVISKLGRKASRDPLTPSPNRGWRCFQACREATRHPGQHRDHASVCPLAPHLASHAQLARKLHTLEKKYDTQFKVVFDAIRELMTPPQTKRRPIAFSRD
jgi:hypothetical protein